MEIKKAKKEIFDHGCKCCHSIYDVKGISFFCSRKEGHKGKHRAGIGNNEYIYEW